MRAILLCFLAIAALAGTAPGRSPMPVVVPAVTPVATAPAAATRDDGSMQPAMKLLQEMKAANEETLRKQTATLQQLDDLQKAADQIKTYTKRG